jgi:uncharacterized short protein YbdD (DUF466 family)
MSRSNLRVASLTHAARRVLAQLWWWLRQVTGDASYENYLRSMRQQKVAHDGVAHLDEKSFYLDQLQRRYSRLNRCC